MDLKGKNVFVTGGVQGIGQAIAYNLTKAGANVFLNYIGNVNTEEVLATHKDNEGKCFISQGDVTNTDDCARNVEEAIEKLGSLDALVNNAGITKDNLFMRMTQAEWDQVLSVNLTGVYNMTKQAIRYFVKAKKGSIVNIGSIVGSSGNPGQVNYSSTKAALIGFSKSLAQELGSRNIRCNVVAPGFIRTAMTDKLNEEQKKALLSKIPMRRMGEAEDIANSVMFLISDVSQYISGTVLHVNGAMY